MGGAAPREDGGGASLASGQMRGRVPQNFHFHVFFPIQGMKLCMISKRMSASLVVLAMHHFSWKERFYEVNDASQSGDIKDRDVMKVGGDCALH